MLVVDKYIMRIQVTHNMMEDNMLHDLTWHTSKRYWPVVASLNIDKIEKNSQVIDVAIPDNGRVTAKEDEKVEKYQGLAREIRKMGIRTKVIPIVVGKLGTIPLRLKENLRTIDVKTSIELIQRCALLGSARILRKVLEM